MDKAMLFFDLADYFIKTGGFSDNAMIKELETVLDFMEGKMFSGMFWKELTSTNQVSISPEGINLDGIIRKDIYYREKIFDQTEIKMMCHSIKVSLPSDLKAVDAIYMEPLLTIFTGLKSMVKDDTVVFRTVGENTPIQFTFDKNPWVYGVVSTDGAIASRNFMFDSLQSFAEDITT